MSLTNSVRIPSSTDLTIASTKWYWHGNGAVLVWKWTYTAVKINFQQVLQKTLIPRMNTLKDMHF